MTEPAPTSELAQAVQDVTERAQLIVREEIELAKAEITTKITKLAKGAGVAVAAGVFILTGLIYLLHAVAWLASDKLLPEVSNEGLDNFWIGFGVVTLLLFLLAGISGFLAYRWLKVGSPTPDMAIHEAQLIRETVTSASEKPK